MNVLDSVKGKMRELTDRANDLSGPANEKLDSAKSAVASGLGSAGKYVDEKTGGKYASTIHSSVGKAKGFLGQNGEQQATDRPSPPTKPPGAAEDSSGKNGPEQPSS
ncbi:antitoxin [Actinospica robiniae]|uniref:antitoxin n=1 Tax=Actinospica robiniae TaxID=304901 RepID=UPI000404B54D|nr:antitoxin [Actinospica robiniae]